MSERNQRLDWALLLPASAVLPLDEVLVLGGSDEMARSLVDHGVASSWRRPGAATDRSELVVAWEDCGLDIDRIARHVRPGGLLYLEVDRRRARRRLLGLRSATRQLGRGGCRVFSAHIVTPNLVRPSRYLPMDHARAVRWHLRTLFVSGSPVMRAARACLSAALATPVADAVLSAVTMRYVVIGTTADDRSAPLGVPIGRGGERAIVVTSGYDQASRTVLLPFPPGDDSPRFAVKVASSSTTAIGTLREHERLICLHARLSPHTARALPRPIGLFSLAERTTCVQTCVAGPSLSTIGGRWGRPLSAKCRDLDVVVDWLIEFGTATRVDASAAECDWTLIYGQAAAAIESAPAVLDFLAEAERIAKATCLGSSAVHQHYDTGPWNVHIDGVEPMLIDWETDDLRPADCLGPPMADIVYFVMYWYFLVTSTRSEADEEAAIVRLFATPAPADAAVVAARRALDRALVCFGLPRRVVPAVLAALWAERAAYTHRRRARLGAPIEPGRTRPEAYLRTLAGAATSMWGPDGPWTLPLGTWDR